MSDDREKNIIKESNEAWVNLSKWWDNDIDDGDPFHRYLVFPTIMKLVDCQKGDKVLDIACGNGTLPRRFAALGADVLGVDVSPVFIEQAEKRSDSSIRYQVLDVTSETELADLVQRGAFDKIVCSMALHDLPVVKPLFQSLPNLLNPKGSFTFSIPHPCFNMGSVTLNFFDKNPSISVFRYTNPEHLLMKSKSNQPIDQHCFHRSMTDIFQQLFSIGMVMNGFVEPALCNVNEDLKDVDLDWKFLPEIPPVLLTRWVFKE